MEPQTDEKIAQEILRLTAERGPEKSACPSEVARALDPEHWRALMTPVRAVAGDLAERGKIIVTQRGEPVKVEAVRGPIRLSIPAGQATGS